MTKHNEGLGVVGWGRLVSWGGSVWLGLWVDSGSLIGDISDISVISVGGVFHVLDSAIGKSNGVRSLSGSSTIRSLLSVEVSLGVVIGNSIGVSVGGNLIGVGLGLVSWGRGVVSWSLDDWGGVDGVGNNGGVHSMGNHGGVVHGVSHGVGNHGGVHGVDGVVDGGVVDSVVHGVGNQLVSTIGAGSNHGEQSSSDESLKIFDPLKKYSLEHSKIFNAFRNF